MPHPLAPDPQRPPARRNRVRIATWRLARILTDLVAGLLAMGGAFWMRLELDLPLTLYRLPEDRIAFLPFALGLVALTQVPILYLFGFYELPHPQERVERLRRLVAATAAQALLLVGVYFLANREFPRSVLVLFAGLNLALLLLSRVAMDRLLLPPRRAAVVVGGGPGAHEIALRVGHYPWYGLEIVGWVPAPFDQPDDVGPGERLGDLADVPELLEQGIADEVILTSAAETWQTELVDRMARGAGRRAGVLLLPGPFDSLLGRMRYRSVYDLPLIEVVREEEWGRTRPEKRALDLLVALLLGVVLLPVLLACVAIVRLADGAPVLYRQTRVGRDQRPFTLWKLRTMRNDAESAGDEVLAQPNDPRLTGVGRVLRNSRLDEIPQLWNVLRGDMSLVGPRPERPGFVRQYLHEVHGYAARFAIPPGLTGLAQVSGDYHSSAENKLRYDLAYLANWSLWLDLSILVRTVKIVLTSRGT
ncbi:MAG TPA: exopolysaccharide biosynthesis polyprenyl glycosylphosphotransferase [Thermoanaerobaculia bacterium]|nr:exopolysaccharide biosynthesis polyprenyl glycosylphosphotransferase [Thermoanaerobaculia bacterium]